MHDAPPGDGDGDGAGVGDRVRDRQRLDGERAELAHGAGHERAQLRLVDAVAQQRQRQRACVDRRRRDGERVRQRGDVVLVRVREQPADDVAGARREIGEVGDEQVDAGRFVVGDLPAAVDAQERAHPPRRR